MEGENILGVAEGYKHKRHRSHNPRATTRCPYRGDRSGKAKSTKVTRQTQRTRVSPWHCFISPLRYGTDLKILNHLSFGSVLYSPMARERCASSGYRQARIALQTEPPPPYSLTVPKLKDTDKY